MIPALMTPVNEEGRPDLDLLVEIASHLATKGAGAFVYAGSMGDWPLLSLQTRYQGVENLVKAGFQVVVGTGAANVFDACSIAEHALNVGAAGLMIIPQQLRRVSCVDAQYHYFDAVLSAGRGVPSVVYNSPYYGFSMKAELFRTLRERHPHLVGFKEFGGAADLTCDDQQITAGDPNLSLLVGVDVQVTHGMLRCNAVGLITGIGNVFPQQVRHLMDLCLTACSDAGVNRKARSLAFELEEAMMPLSKYDEGPDLVLYYKYLMSRAGHRGYDRQIVATDRLSPAQMTSAARLYHQFLNWWENWEGRTFSFSCLKR